MKAKIKTSVERLFTPEFHTSIGGQSVRLTRKELTRNWHKYIYTSASSVYENLTELRDRFKKLKGKVDGVKAEVLDMSKANSRGTSFSQPTQKQKTEKAIEAFQAKQKRNLERIAAKKVSEEKAKEELVKKITKSERDKLNRKAKREAEKAEEERKKAERKAKREAEKAEEERKKAERKAKRNN